MTMEDLSDIFGNDDSNLEAIPGGNPDIDIDSTDFFGEGSGSSTEPSLLDDFLKLRGITDSKIKILDENDEEQEINFYNLTKEEQLDILNAVPEESANNDLDEAELNLFNHLRTNNLTVQDFLAQYREEIIAELGKTPEITYNVDAYDDQELFLLDLKNKFDSLTDEELVAELDKELKNPEILAKKVTKLREEYKLLEDQHNTNLAAETAQQQEAEYNQFADQMVSIAVKTEGFHGIDLEDEDKNETLAYLLEVDDKGVSKFYKDLSDPTKLYEAAWYLRYGKEAFDAIKNAYEAEITKLKKTPDKPRAVVQNSNKTSSNIHDLF